MVGLIIAQPKNPEVSNPETKIAKHHDLEKLKSSVSRNDKTVSKPSNLNFYQMLIVIWIVLLCSFYFVMIYAKENKNEQLETVALVIACILQFWPALVPLVLLALVLISLVLWLVLTVVLCVPFWKWEDVLQVIYMEEGRDEKKHMIDKKKKRKEDY